jgi:subtilisin family serine protease
MIPRWRDGARLTCLVQRGGGMTIRRTKPSRWGNAPRHFILALLTLAVALNVVPFQGATPVAPASAQETSATGDEVIVVLEDGADPVQAAAEMGAEVTHIYRHIFTGFAGVLPPEAQLAAQTARSVRRISLDSPVQAEGQKIATGVRRIGAPHQPGSRHLEITSPIDADIAILDSGVTRRSDLKVVDGKSCVNDKSGKKSGGQSGDETKNKNKNKKNKKKSGKGKSKPWEDNNGHGTHTAGIAAAQDNREGVVGVAPGARIWAVKVLDSQGEGSFGTVICGLDWVYKHRKEIDVVNLSLSGEGAESDCDDQSLHKAICKVVEAGVPVVVAAGNQGQNVAGDSDSRGRVPARYDEVITVSGFADSDAEPGGDGPITCFRSDDDTFLRFSNFGKDVDIAAPGDCILSLWNNGNAREESGTSEAAPHVTGAVANYVAIYEDEHGKRPTAEQSREWLLTEASVAQDSAFGFTGDPDDFPEPMLWLALLDEP